MPRVSVLMPVYNSSLYLREAIQSILDQTYRDLEFIIVNDGSKDDSEQIVRSFDDPRIKYTPLESNKGIVIALNTGLELARGEYIVRMDGDDIADRSRIEKQVKFLDENPDVGVAGSWVKYFGKKSGVMKTLADHAEITWTLTMNAAIFHPSVIIRKSVLKAHALKYSSRYPHVEDYLLWVELAGRTKLANVQDTLLNYRFTSSSVSSVHRSVQDENASKVSRYMHEILLGRKLTEAEWDAVDFRSKKPFSIRLVVSLYNEMNRKASLFPAPRFNQLLTHRVKQLVLKKKADAASMIWLLLNSAKDLTLIKYFFLNIIKK